MPNQMSSTKRRVVLDVPTEHAELIKNDPLIKNYTEGNFSIICREAVWRALDDYKNKEALKVKYINSNSRKKVIFMCNKSEYIMLKKIAKETRTNVSIIIRANLLDICDEIKSGAPYLHRPHELD
jgi:hypothetical protein